MVIIWYDFQVENISDNYFTSYDRTYTLRIHTILHSMVLVYKSNISNLTITIPINFVLCFMYRMSMAAHIHSLYSSSNAWIFDYSYYFRSRIGPIKYTQAHASSSIKHPVLGQYYWHHFIGEFSTFYIWCGADQEKESQFAHYFLRKEKSKQHPLYFVWPSKRKKKFESFMWLEMHAANQ